MYDWGYTDFISKEFTIIDNMISLKDIPSASLKFIAVLNSLTTTNQQFKKRVLLESQLWLLITM